MDHSLIKQYKNVVPDQVTDWIMGAVDSSHSLVRRCEGPQDFYELNLNQAHPEVVGALVPYLRQALEQYKNDIPETTWFPDQLALEEFRAKRYTGGTGQQFADHVDVGNHVSSKRYLAFLFYLNDNFEGGETIFLPGYTIKPDKGSVVVFPPLWMYPHRGCPVNTGTKYIMSSYLNYT